MSVSREREIKWKVARGKNAAAMPKRVPAALPPRPLPAFRPGALRTRAEATPVHAPDSSGKPVSLDRYVKQRGEVTPSADIGTRQVGAAAKVSPMQVEVPEDVTSRTFLEQKNTNGDFPKRSCVAKRPAGQRTLDREAAYGTVATVGRCAQGNMAEGRLPKGIAGWRTEPLTRRTRILTRE